jgi:hypothetical protein
MSEDHKSLLEWKKLYPVLQKIGVNLSYASLIYEEKIESVMEEKEESGSQSESAH